jgi:hypothetical protein
MRTIAAEAAHTPAAVDLDRLPAGVREEARVAARPGEMFQSHS